MVRVSKGSSFSSENYSIKINEALGDRFPFRVIGSRLDMFQGFKFNKNQWFTLSNIYLLPILSSLPLSSLNSSRTL